MLLGILIAVVWVLYFYLMNFCSANTMVHLLCAKHYLMGIQKFIKHTDSLLSSKLRSGLKGKVAMEESEAGEG